MISPGDWVMAVPRGDSHDYRVLTVLEVGRGLISESTIVVEGDDGYRAIWVIEDVEPLTPLAALARQAE